MLHNTSNLLTIVLYLCRLWRCLWTAFFQSCKVRLWSRSNRPPFLTKNLQKRRHFTTVFWWSRRKRGNFLSAGHKNLAFLGKRRLIKDRQLVLFIGDIDVWVVVLERVHTHFSRANAISKRTISNRKKAMRRILSTIIWKQKISIGNCPGGIISRKRSLMTIVGKVK